MQEPRMGQHAMMWRVPLASLAWAFSGPRMTADGNAPFLFPHQTNRAKQKENLPNSLAATNKGQWGEGRRNGQRKISNPRCDMHRRIHNRMEGRRSRENGRR